MGKLCDGPGYGFYFGDVRHHFPDSVSGLDIDPM